MPTGSTSNDSDYLFEFSNPCSLPYVANRYAARTHFGDRFLQSILAGKTDWTVKPVLSIQTGDAIAAPGKPGTLPQPEINE